MDASSKETGAGLANNEADGDHVSAIEETLRDIPVGDLIQYLESYIAANDAVYLQEPDLWPPANPLQAGGWGELNGDPDGPANMSVQMQLAELQNLENREREAHNRAREQHEWDRAMAVIEIFTLRNILERKKEELDSYP